MGTIPKIALMRFFRWWTIAVCLGAGVAQAQVDLKLEVPRTQFLPGERLEVVTRFSNFTGKPLTLGAEAGWLRFQVEDRAGVAVNRRSELPETGTFELQPVERGTLRFDIEPHFYLEQPGRYRVFAIARFPSGEEVTTPPASFELVRGTRVAEQPYGFSSPEGAERRKYILHQANYLEEVVLYVRCTDEAEATTYQVTRLGKTVNFTQPKQILDVESRWHVLHQFGRTDFIYHVFAPDGSLVVRQTLMFEDRRPQLRVNEQGKVTVIGGVRRPTDDDVPGRATPSVVAPALFTPDDATKKKR